MKLHRESGKGEKQMRPMFVFSFCRSFVGASMESTTAVGFALIELLATTGPPLGSRFDLFVDWMQIIRKRVFFSL